MPNITAIRSIVIRPATENLVVVRVETEDPALWGIGCATFTQRYAAVTETIDRYLAPLVVGRDAARITELWQLMHLNGYWRNGPVINNAISGIDQALWDIKGKTAGLPVYELLGGKVREAAAVYQHAVGRDPGDLVRDVRRLIQTGVRHVRCQISASPHSSAESLSPNSAGYGGSRVNASRPDGALEGAYYDPQAYRREILAGLDAVRSAVGGGIELIHDVHSRLTPADTIQFARDLEPYKLFFLEDALPPEHLGWYGQLRESTTTPLAVGELFTNRAEWLPLVAGRQIDFLRLHVSAVGGLTPAWQATQLCEAFGVRTAFHGPKDTSPVGHTAQLHIDLATTAFGIQEFAPFTENEHKVFSGLPELRDGYLYPNTAPGWGVEIDEEAARAYPPLDSVIGWTQARLPDGTITFP